MTRSIEKRPRKAVLQWHPIRALLTDESVQILLFMSWMFIWFGGTMATLMVGPNFKDGNPQWTETRIFVLIGLQLPWLLLVLRILGVWLKNHPPIRFEDV